MNKKERRIARQSAKKAERILKRGTITLPPGLPSPSGGKSPALDFSTALLRGDPTAQQAMKEALKKPRTLADQFIASTYIEGERLGIKGKARKDFDEGMRRYRQDMMRAHRFVLDDDFVRLSTTVSSTSSAEKVLTRLQFATLPYEITWIEFDLHVRMQMMRAIHHINDPDLSLVSKREGVLLYRLSDTEALCTLVQDWTMFGREAVLPNMVCYYFSTVEHDFKQDRPIHGCDVLGAEYTFNEERNKSWFEKAWRHPRTGKMVDEQELHDMAAEAGNIAKAALWGITNKKQAASTGFVRDLTELRTPDFLNLHGDAGFSRMYNIYRQMREHDVGPGKADRELSEVVAAELTEFAGTVRYVVHVLAMLNEVPVHTDYVPSPGQETVARIHPRKLFDYHRVTLRLPKRDPVKQIERHISPTARRRAHEVRGHWRTYLHETACAKEEHQWEYDHEAGYRLCGKCMAYSRFIREHIRGDASLGWVRKDYVIKSST